MKRFPLLIGFVFLCSVLSAQQWHTTLDVRRAAKATFPAQINDLLIVNNAISQPDDFGHALILFEKNSSERIDLSNAPLLTLFAVAEELDKSGLFSSVSVYEKSVASGTFFASNSLTKGQTMTLCNEYNSDAVLALDRVVIYDKKEVYEATDMNFYAYLEVYAVSNWTLSLPSGKFYSLSHSDTLYWDGFSYNSGIALDELPDRKTALLDVAQFTGVEFAKQYIPQWETVDRYLYSNENEHIVQGLEHFTYQRWQQAVDAWMQAWLESSKQQSNKSQRVQVYETAAYAAANMAVAEEIMGDLKAAVKWAKLSAETFGKIDKAEALQQQVNMVYYQRQLEQREKEF